MKTIGIIGYGYVGKAVAHAVGSHCDDVYIYDKYNQIDSLDTVLKKSDCVFICLPTPFNENTFAIDLTTIDNTIAEIAPQIPSKTVIIKSTVIPGTTRRYADTYPDVRFAFCPEFLTEVNYLHDAVNPDRIIVGTDDIHIARDVVQMLTRAHSQQTIVHMRTTEAEIVKYQSNVMLAAKVALCNVFYDICEAHNARYFMVRDGVSLDSRIGTSHMNVTPERGFGGKCFPKDLGAIIGHTRSLGVDCAILEAIYQYNMRVRTVKDWRNIAGATVQGVEYEFSGKSCKK